MLKFTEAAKAELQNLLKDKDANTVGIRLSLGEGNSLQVATVELDKLSPDEAPLRDPITSFFVEYEAYMLVVTPEAQDKLGQATLDFASGGALSGTWTFAEAEVIPQEVYQGPDLGDPMIKQVSDLLEKEINPGLAAHGGRAELLNVVDNKVYLRFGGGCQGCSMIDATVKQGIETRIKEVIPQILGVVDETDHAAGNNPYFQ